MADAQVQPHRPGKRHKGNRDTPSLTAAPLCLEIAASEDKGARSEQEDVWTSSATAASEELARLDFCAILDGHAGHAVAELAAQHLHTCVLRAGLADAQAHATRQEAAMLRKAVSQGFRDTDKLCLEACKAQKLHAGATCVAVWVLGSTLIVASIGDAKCVLARQRDDSSDPGADGANLKAVTLTQEHKAIMASEKARIERAGGHVSSNGRLAGKLEVSRSFGDLAYKKQGLTSVPDIKVFSIAAPRDAFLLLGCDGFWGIFGAEDAVQFAGAELAKGGSAKHTCNRLINEAVRARKCKDNCTVGMVRFTAG